MLAYVAAPLLVLFALARLGLTIAALADVRGRPGGVEDETVLTPPAVRETLSRRHVEENSVARVCRLRVARERRRRRVAREVAVAVVEVPPTVSPPSVVHGSAEAPRHGAPPFTR